MRVQATDADGGTGTGQKAVSIENRNPTVTVDGPASGFRGQDLTFTATGADADPGAAAPTLEWDTDGDGFDDGTGASKTVQYPSLGSKTVRVRATDVDGGTGTAQKAVTIENRLPSVEFSGGPATGFRGETLQFTAQASDADPGIPALTFAWDTDGDGFDDGTGFSKSVSFASLGAKTVRVRVTDPDGGTATADRVVTIINRDPTVSITGGPAEGFRNQDLTFTATGADARSGRRHADVHVGHRRRRVRRRHGRLEDGAVHLARRQDGARAGDRRRRWHRHRRSRRDNRQPRARAHHHGPGDRLPRPGPRLHGVGGRRRSGHSGVRLGHGRRRVRRRHRRHEDGPVRLAGGQTVRVRVTDPENAVGTAEKTSRSRTAIRRCR